MPIRAKAFSLLCHLARNAGRVISKDELLDNVWAGVTVTEDSLTQTVRDLRRAIGDDRQEIVRTIARRGYLFAIPADDPAAPPAEARGVAQPRVAVLPFRNLTGDQEKGVLIDGIVEEITHGLARFKTVTVLARHSAFAFRPEERASLQTVGAQLGADYLVEGSARGGADRITITVGLCEAHGGSELWGEAFDGGPLALLDVVPRRIVTRLVSNIEDLVSSRSSASPTSSPTAFEHLTRAIALLRSFGDGVNERGRDHLLRAIEIDPGYGLAHAYLALAEVMIGGYGLAPREVRERARDRAMTAIVLAPEEGRCHRFMAYIRQLLREYPASEQSMRRALELNPYDADTLMMMGLVLTSRGRAAEGLEWIDRAILLNPLYPAFYHSERSITLYMLGRYDEAVETLQCLPRLSVRQETRLAATLAMAGRMEEAAWHLDRAEALHPGWPHVEAARNSYNFERSEDLEHLLTGIRTALEGRGGLR